MADHLHPEEITLTGIGLRSRVAAPLLLGDRPIGMLAILRRRPDAFDEDEIELAALLGRLLASGVQNIRAYESERATVAELRRPVRPPGRLRLARLARAAQPHGRRDRSCADARGALARAEPRPAFRLPRTDRGRDEPAGDPDRGRARHVPDRGGHVLVRFSDVDVAELVRETVATLSLGQDEVASLTTRHRRPHVRGDRERLRQVLTNLRRERGQVLAGRGEVDVRRWARTAACSSRSRTAARHPARAAGLIFEKFGRANVGGGKPGTGLGLFIARSIARRTAAR
jgi:signal transduction histidine kinase